jgi:glycosyltransferase involved in cell wall biosynthesis
MDKSAYSRSTTSVLEIEEATTIRKWDNSLLEPVVITYNRSTRLERMIRTFIQAGYTSMRFHILDNCSTDNTRDVVEYYRDKYWPLLYYHRNKYNIGGDANILRAVEISDSEYFCVFGDDDEWNLEYFDEVTEILSQGEADIIRLGWQASQKSQGQLLPASDLVYNDPKFLISLWAMSNVIVRKSLISCDLFSAYRGINCHAPLLPPIWKLIESKNLLVYTCSRRLCSIVPSEANDEPNYWMGDMGWDASWLRLGKFFKTSALRAEHVNNLFAFTNPGGGRISILMGLMFRILMLKGNGFSQRGFLLEILQNAVGKRGLYALLLFFDLFVPKAPLAWIVSWRRRHGGSIPIYYRPLDEIVADREARI